MRYRTFVLLSAVGMLLATMLLALLLAWLDPDGNPTLGILGGVLAMAFVLALDLAMWRFAPQTLERMGFQLGEQTHRDRHENMPVEEDPAGIAPRKVYRMDAGLRILFYVGAIIIALMGLGLGALYLAGVDTTGRRPDVGPIGHTLLVFFFLSAGAFMVHAARSERLVLSPEGVEYRTPGYSVASSWENVEAIGPATYYRGRKVESLLLRQPGLRDHGILGALASLFAPGRAIPLESFGSPRYGPLSRDLREFAPHLFDTDGLPVRSDGIS